MKRCPFCAEEIQDDAIVCRFCGRELAPRQVHEVVAGIERGGRVERGGQLPVASGVPERGRKAPAAGLVWLAFLGLLVIDFGSALILLGIAPDWESFSSLSAIANLGLRVWIGYLAVRDRSEIRARSNLAKTGIFLLAFIPIGSWFALYYASRQLAASGMFWAAVGLVVLGGGLLALASASDIGEVATVVGQATYRTPYVSTPRPRNPTARPTVRASATAASCRRSEDVSPGDIGEYLSVCGVVVEEGEVPCEACGFGAYSYLVLEGDFNIISYDWNFFSTTSESWVGDCVQVVDKVEPLGGKPAFVMSKAEGYASSECYTNSSGVKVCRGGDYFRTCR